MVLGCRLLASEKKKGRFNLGKWSTPITMVGFSWAVFAILAFVLPTSWPMTGIYKEKAYRTHYTELSLIGDTFNYAGVGFIIVILTTVSFWLGWGRYHYEGPKAMNDEI
jgi:hypothetical protein